MHVTLQQIIFKIEQGQRFIIEMYTQSILNVPIGNFLSTTWNDERLQPYYDLEIYSITVGPNDTICIKI